MKIAAAITVLAIAVAGTAAAQTAGDPVKGEKVFQRCKACHSAEKEGADKLGPNLWGVVGRKSASEDGFNYSPAMKAANKTWDAATLDVYLTKPAALVPGTRMAFPGIPSAQDRADVIAYLSGLK
ncbi:c-type cytochrome [Nitrospirillum viridazoti]|uniref:Cytochrome c family protein n=1 Tax=Nitrospirillum viridazoti CBAmc TaxID=1441467 RepID=A0A248JRI9_9PROT|nr:cytochrome c family protein [Nitrospirillum amazonense]ASG21146.1 cytochrome c family protein [Nitrospirillum amazonense CBAmc]TWB28131.1 cytochrome c [Nitrospirillum amazonense]